MDQPPPTHELFLASASPARADLLAAAGYRFRRVVTDGEEEAPDSPSPSLHVLYRALAKAASAARRLKRGVIVAADTVAACEGKIIGKPADEAEAAAILRRLSRTPHDVLTGLCVRVEPGGPLLCGVEITRVHMRPMNEEDIAAYVASGEAMGKAGAYAVQETGDRFVERVEGSFSNVVGLPMELLGGFMEILANRGIVVPRKATGA